MTPEKSGILAQFGVDWPHFIAQLILFLIVYFVLSRYAFKPLLAILEDRRKRIEEGQLNAEKIKKQLAEAELRYQEVLRKANDDAQALIEESRKNNEAFSRREMEKAVKESAALVERARHDPPMDHHPGGQRQEQADGCIEEKPAAVIYPHLE